MPFHDTYYDRTKHASLTHLLASLVMITDANRYETLPHDRVLMVSAFIMSHWRSPTAVGRKPSLPTSSRATIYLDDVCRFERS